MTTNSYIHHQLAVAHQRDLLAAADRYRLAAQARAHERHWFPSRALRREAQRQRPIESSLCMCGPRTATS